MAMAWSWRQTRRRPHRAVSRAGWAEGRQPPAPQPGHVPSPGGWAVPAGVRPAWNWAPPPGIVPRPDRAARWVRWWYWTPFADRYAYAWMWRHGAWDVVPPGVAQPGGDGAGVREPRRPAAPAGTATAAAVPEGGAVMVLPPRPAR
jgi:hypothetical protein